LLSWRLTPAIPVCSLQHSGAVECSSSSSRMATVALSASTVDGHIDVVDSCFRFLFKKNHSCGAAGHTGLVPVACWSLSHSVSIDCRLLVYWTFCAYVRFGIPRTPTMLLLLFLLLPVPVALLQFVSSSSIHRFVSYRWLRNTVGSSCCSLSVYRCSRSMSPPLRSYRGTLFVSSGVGLRPGLLSSLLALSVVEAKPL
jgi:hypothetical protein